MTKIYTLALAGLFSLAAVAAERPKKSSITITTYENNPIRVEINGRSYDERDNDFTLSNVQSGYQTIKVYSYNNTSRGIGGIFGGNREKLIYDSRVYIRPAHEVEIMINRNGRADVREYDLSRGNGRKNKKYKKNDDWNERRDDDRRDRRDDDDDDDDYRNDDRWDNGKGGGYSNGREVSGSYFQSLKESLRRESFENNRLSAARQMVQRNSFSSYQVREMLQLFSFESNRLDLAKTAYPTTVDKSNFLHVLYDAFSFNNSKQELARFVNSYR